MQNRKQIDHEEKQVSEQSEITVIDENVPSPSEVRRNETM